MTKRRRFPKRGPRLFFFETRKVEIIEIGRKVNVARLPRGFIADAKSTAFEFDGVYDMLKPWSAEADHSERDEIVADIRELIDDCSQKKKALGLTVRFDDPDAGAKKTLFGPLWTKEAALRLAEADGHPPAIAFTLFQHRNGAPANDAAQNRQSPKT